MVKIISTSILLSTFYLNNVLSMDVPSQNSTDLDYYVTHNVLDYYYRAKSDLKRCDRNIKRNTDKWESIVGRYFKANKRNSKSLKKIKEKLISKQDELTNQIQGWNDCFPERKGEDNLSKSKTTLDMINYFFKVFRNIESDEKHELHGLIREQFKSLKDLHDNIEKLEVDIVPIKKELDVAEVLMEEKLNEIKKTWTEEEKIKCGTGQGDVVCPTSGVIFEFWNSPLFTNWNNMTAELGNNKREFKSSLNELVFAHNTETDLSKYVYLLKAEEVLPNVHTLDEKDLEWILNNFDSVWDLDFQGANLIKMLIGYQEELERYHHITITYNNILWKHISNGEEIRQMIIQQNDKYSTKSARLRSNIEKSSAVLINMRKDDSNNNNSDESYDPYEYDIKDDEAYNTDVYEDPYSSK